MNIVLDTLATIWVLFQFGAGMMILKQGDFMEEHAGIVSKGLDWRRLLIWGATGLTIWRIWA